VAAIGVMKRMRGVIPLSLVVMVGALLPLPRI